MSERFPNHAEATESRMRPDIHSLAPAQLLCTLAVTEGHHLHSDIRALYVRGARTVAALHEAIPFAHDYRLAAQTIARRASTEHADQILLVIVGPQLADADPTPATHRALVEVTGQECQHASVGLRALWCANTTPGATWASYDTDAQGTVAPIEQSPEFTPGQVGPFAHLADLRHATHEDDPEHTARLGALIDDHLTSGEADTDPPAILARVQHMLDGHQTPDTDECLVDLAVGLGDYLIRDALIHHTLRRPLGRSEALWLALTRTLPAPERADAAVLLAISALRRANRALCDTAVNTTLTAAPSHPLAMLLRDACDQPDTWPRVIASLHGMTEAAHQHLSLPAPPPDESHD
ncbi:DUF4192 domain-containing protein [Kutzneria sp. 744]|uniref:DUF4192 domain-containing protein n=1 Tax=Kutzneria sp. (strain 744) TaxID=345341 RepID=UPI0003EEB4E4|nr:DUF4192 domain-containing protein [Kutzneria sp. 744]EWM19691.1 mucin-2 [Kutzneria sp. 744]